MAATGAVVVGVVEEAVGAAVVEVDSAVAVAAIPAVAARRFKTKDFRF
jgi:hypothetical protein